VSSTAPQRIGRSVAVAGRLTLGLGLLGLALSLLWGAIWLHLAEVKRHELAAAERDGRSMARGLEQNIVRTIESADQLLRYVQIGYRQNPKDFDLFEWLKLRPHDALSVQLALIDPQGKLAVTSLNARPDPVDLSDREHFRVHLGTDEDRLFISKPVLGRVSGRWTIQVTRPLRDTEGRFGGVLVLSMDTEYLARFYDAVRQQDSMIRLVGDDGIVRAAAPAPAGTLGAAIPTALLQQMREGGEGQFLGPDSDGVERLTTFRRVQGYPLYILAGIGMDEVLEAYRFDRKWASLLGGVLSLGLSLIAWLLLRQAGQLERGRQALRSTLDNMAQGVVMADAGGRIQVMNGQAQRLLELDGPAAAPGGPIAAVLEKAGVERRDSRHERRTAAGQAVETLAFPLADGGLLLTATDVTQQRLASEAEAAARDAAEAANRSKSDFLANMSHEIRTPMNGVLGMLQALQHSGLTPTQMAMCETMARSGGTLLRVVNDILDGARLEAGKMSLMPTPTDVAPLVQDIVELMRAAATEKGIAIQVDTGDRQLPAVLLDPLRLRQILTNLLSNAVKFSDRGTVSVRLHCQAPQDGRIAMAICVRDQGPGIASEALAGLFTRFGQAEGGRRRAGGSGLGLAISRDLARLMGGDIEAESRRGEGSAFTLRLTPEVAPPAAAADIAAPPMLATARTLDILIAEDDAMNRMVMSSFLEPTGHRFRFAHDGGEVLEVTRQQRFDVILMDASMPVLDGVGATAAIRAAEANTGRHTPIIALTAHAMTGDRERYLGAGMDGYVSKPIDRQVLFQEIDRVLAAAAAKEGALTDASGPR
jgi:signal transduction histidine kinase/ActR/RegA family two-component response regulator